MPSRRRVTIGDIAETIAMGPFGSNIKVETFQSEGVPVISGAHLHGVRLDDGAFNFVSIDHANKLGRSNVRRGDVVFTHAGNIGQVVYIPENSKFDRYVISQRQFYLRCNNDADPRYIAYYFRSPIGRHALLANASQVGVPSIARPATYLRSIELLLPSMPEQIAIADALSTLDDKIALNRRMNETLEEMARAIFKDWFVDFGPTRAKMEGRAPYLDPDIWSLFPDRLDVEGKPEGWKLRPVGDFAELRGGKQLEKKRITSVGTIPVFGGAGVMGFTDEHNAEGFVISIGRVGAYCGQFFSHRGKAWINNNASLIRQFEEVSGEWLFQSLQHADIEVIKKGAAQPFVSNTDVGNMPIIWPGEHVVARFADVAVPLMLRMEHNDAEASRLAATRDILLPKLMSGKVRIKDTEKLVGEA